MITVYISEHCFQYRTKKIWTERWLVLWDRTETPWCSVTPARFAYDVLIIT